MRWRALLVAPIFVLLLWLAFAALNSADLQKSGFYMVGSEGNTITLYGIDCNAEINEAANTITVYHNLFTATSETNGFPDVSCDSNSIHISNAIETNVLDAKCAPDENALPETVRCGEGCRIAEAKPYDVNGKWFIYIKTWGAPDQLCIDGRCSEYGRTTEEFNVPAHEGNVALSIVCGGYSESRVVTVAGRENKRKGTGKIAKNNARMGEQNAYTRPKINTPTNKEIHQMCR